MFGFELLPLSTAFINHALITTGIGFGPMLAVKPDYKATVFLISITSIVLILTQAINKLLVHIFLIPFNLMSLHTEFLIFVAVIIIEIVDLFVTNLFPSQRYLLGALTPLSISNTSILALTVITIKYSTTIETIIVFGLSLTALTCGRILTERIRIPHQFCGLPIDLISLGLILTVIQEFLALIQ